MRARKHGLGAVLGPALLIVVATAVPALAQPSSSKTEYPTCKGEVSKSDSEAAHAKYISGKFDYDEAKYDAAIQNFRAAYERDCTKHELLVIISRAYEADGKLAEAIRALEVYVERQPSSPDTSTHQKRIANLKEKLAAQRTSATATATATATPTATSGGGGTSPPPGGEAQGHTVYPFLVGGAGVVAASIGVTLLIAKPDTGCDLDTQTCAKKDGESQEDYTKRQQDAGRERGWGIAGPILIAGGAAMIVGGVVWYFLEPTGQKDTAKTKVQPQIGPGYGGFALTGRF